MSTRLGAMRMKKNNHFYQALLAGRHEYQKVALSFVLICFLLGGVGFFAKRQEFFWLATGMAATGLVLFFVSLVGLYRFYGTPSLVYYRKIVSAAGLEGKSLSLADLHLGTY